MGTFDELASTGKEFSMLLSLLQEGKEKDSESLSSRVSYFYYLTVKNHKEITYCC